MLFCEFCSEPIGEFEDLIQCEDCEGEGCWHCVDPTTLLCVDCEDDEDELENGEDNGYADEATYY